MGGAIEQADAQEVFAADAVVLACAGFQGNAEMMRTHLGDGDECMRAFPGAKAFARSTHRQSATCLEEALVALHHLPQSSAMLEQAVDVCLALRNSLFPLGDLEIGLGHLRDAKDLAKKLDDQRRLARIAAYMSEYARLTAHAADAHTFA